MTRFVTLSTAFALTLFAAQLTAKSSPANPSAASLPLTVRIYDYAGPGTAIIERAQQEASRVLAHVDIAATWLNCPLTMEQRETNASCASPAGPTDLVVRVLPPKMHPAASSETQTFGHALIANDKPAPRIASILFGNVERLAWARDMDSSYGTIHRSITHERYVGILLGHVIAHEIGHLLLATNKHSRRGLMIAHWDASVTEDAILRRLQFEPGERKRIGSQLLRRLQQD